MKQQLTREQIYWQQAYRSSKRYNTKTKFKKLLNNAKLWLGFKKHIIGE